LTCPGGLAAQEKTILPCLKTMDFFQFVPGMGGGNSTQVSPVELAIDDIAVVPQFKAGSYYIHNT